MGSAADVEKIMKIPEAHAVVELNGVIRSSDVYVWRHHVMVAYGKDIQVVFADGKTPNSLRVIGLHVPGLLWVDERNQVRRAPNSLLTGKNRSAADRGIKLLRANHVWGGKYPAL